MLLCQHCGIFPKMHIASIQIGDVFIGVHRKLHERRAFGRAFWPRPLRLHGWSSWLVKLLFFGCALAGKHISSQATTQYSPSQHGRHAEEPIEGQGPTPYILTKANIPRPLCHKVPHCCGQASGMFKKKEGLLLLCTPCLKPHTPTPSAALGRIKLPRYEKTFLTERKGQISVFESYLFWCYRSKITSQEKNKVSLKNL